MWRWSRSWFSQRQSQVFDNLFRKWLVVSFWLWLMSWLWCHEFACAFVIFWIRTTRWEPPDWLKYEYIFFD